MGISYKQNVVGHPETAFRCYVMFDDPPFSYNKLTRFFATNGDVVAHASCKQNVVAYPQGSVGCNGVPGCPHFLTKKTASSPQNYHHLGVGLC